LDKYSVNLVKFTEYDAYIRGIDSSKIIVTDALANAEIGMLVKRIEK
jgi:hypothetical protein